MNLDRLSDEELKDLVLKRQLEYIKICQDDFLAFAKAVWPDFIYRKAKDPKNYGHHQLIAKSFEDIALEKEKDLLSICHLDILSQSLLLIYFQPG